MPLSKSIQQSYLFDKYFQICSAIDDYLRINSKALYTVYSIGDLDDEHSERHVEVGLEAGQTFANSYEELIPRRGFVTRVFSAARRGFF